MFVKEIRGSLSMVKDVRVLNVFYYCAVSGTWYIKANSMSLKYTGKRVLQTVRQVLNDVNE